MKHYFKNKNLIFLFVILGISVLSSIILIPTLVFADESEIVGTTIVVPNSPTILSIIADDPDGTIGGEPSGLTDGDTITVTFNEATNRPTAATTSDLNALFSFLQIIGTNYVGTWTSPSVLLITITDSTGNTVTVGSLTITVQAAANLKNQAETSFASTDTSPALIGSFGLKAGPFITLLDADDPDGTVFPEPSGLTDDDTITVRFSEDTNRIGFAVGATLPQATIDSLFIISESIGTTYSGVFTNSRTLVITIANAAGGIATVGSLTLTLQPSANLQDFDETSSAGG